MRLVIDAVRCQGHASCHSCAPDLIELSEEDGHARSLGQLLDAAQLAEARMAVQACPEGAIRLE
jgi:ferredoxin